MYTAGVYTMYTRVYFDHWNESLRCLNNPRGRGENDAIVTEAEPRSLLHPDPRGFSNRGDRLTRGWAGTEFSGLTGLEPGTESAVSLSLFDSVRDPLPSWLCPPDLGLETAKAHLLIASRLPPALPAICLV